MYIQRIYLTQQLDTSRGVVVYESALAFHRGQTSKQDEAKEIYLITSRQMRRLLGATRSEGAAGCKFPCAGACNRSVCSEAIINGKAAA